MAIQSSYAKVAEQVVTFNNNLVDMLSKINDLVTSSEPSITLNVTDQSGIVRQFNLPSFGFLKSEIDRLNNNINSIYSINESGALIQPSNGTKFKRIVTVDLNREPNDISNLSPLTTFVTRKNWFFDGLLNPQIFIELDLTGKVENNVRKILSRRYIIEFSKDSDGNLTPLGQSALNSFNTLFRGNNSFTLDEFEKWHENTTGVVSPSQPNYDEQMFDLEPNRLELDGTFTVILVEEDTINRKLWYHVDTLTYSKNVLIDGSYVKEAKQLETGDELIINTPTSSTRYKIIEISTTESNPRLRLERVEGNEPIPVGVGTLKIYSPVLYDKKVLVSVGYDERNVIFVKGMNMDNYILSKNWSIGVGFYTNDLREFSSNLSMEQFYTDQVLDYGQVLTDMVNKKIPNKLFSKPNQVELLEDNFEVVQINRHLTDIPDSNLIKVKHNQQKNLKSEINQLTESISSRNKTMRVQRFVSPAEKKQFQNELDLLNKQKESKSNLLNSVTSEILDLSNSPSLKVDPIFRVRGYWDIPESIITKGTKPQEVIQFRIQYKYLSRDGKESTVNTKKLSGTNKVATFTNWVELKSDVRKRSFDSSTGEYTWEVEDISDPDKPNINQVDIPIKYGERVAIRVKSISEVGWPESPIESEWSEELVVDFPDSLNELKNENDFISREANKEDLRSSVKNDLTAMGLDEHLSEQITVNDTTYHHSTDKILSGFKDENGISIDLFQYLRSLENRIKSLEDQIKKSKGELEVIVYRNSQSFIIKNGSEISFNVECEDYLDEYTETGVPTGRVYQNNIYSIKDFLVKVRNKSVDSPLGLLSNRTYDVSNSDVYNSSTPQVFWVNQEDELVLDNSTGTSKTQRNFQFLWSVNYDTVNETTATKVSENIGNNFVSLNSNSITNVLSSNEFNIGYSEGNILTFVGNNNSLLDVNKWIDNSPSVSSTNKLLTSIHPQIQNLDVIQETNSDKIKTLNGGEENDVNIPINIYFKMNSLDSSQSGLNYEYINLNSSINTIRHIKKVKFLLENEADNRPFIFTLKFVINRSKVITQKTRKTTSTQLTS